LKKEGQVYAPHIGTHQVKIIQLIILTWYITLEHCLESLRHYVMCKADATILTWYWPEKEPQPPAKYYPQTNYTFQQQCVNLPKLQDWAISNSFELSPQTIFHPKYGKYRDIAQDKSPSI
jgi:hypothetical protein